MRLGRCPVCHAHIHLDALAQDEAGRELMSLLAGLDAGLGRALAGYLTLFRPERSGLSNDRALRLAREVLALCTDSVRLARALAETVEAIRAKGEARRMGNHNYLRRVLEGTQDVAPAVPQDRAMARGASVRLSATEEAILAIRKVGMDGQAHTHADVRAAHRGERKLVERNAVDDDAIDV